MSRCPRPLPPWDLDLSSLEPDLLSWPLGCRLSPLDGPGWEELAPRPRSEDLVLVPCLLVALFLGPFPYPNSSLDEEGCTGGGGGGGAAKAAAKEAREEAEEDGATPPVAAGGGGVWELGCGLGVGRGFGWLGWVGWVGWLG